MSEVSPVLAGLRQRCGSCGEGRLYTSYLKLAPACPVCGADFTKADTADGPAFFVGFAVLILLAPFFFVLPMMDLAVWVKAAGYAVIIAATAGLSLALLPIAKGVLLNLQLRHKAEEAKFEDR